jgi:biotin carboxyl carrier protein
VSKGLMTEADTQPVVADAANIRERVVVSPCSGRFHPLPPESFTTEGEWVEPGQVLAEVHNADAVVDVRSAFRGWVMGMLALDGQPVKDGDALLWIWSA